MSPAVFFTDLDELEFYLEDESREVIQKIASTILSSQPVKGFNMDVDSDDAKLSTAITCVLNK